MSDISDLLTTIQNEESGEQVRSAIANSLDLLQNGVDISEELYSIRKGRYGADIRNAIHDALKKISEYQPSPEPPEQYIGVSELIFIGTDNSETGIADADYSRQYEAIMTITAKRGSDTLNLVQMSELNFYDGSDNKLVLQLANVTSSQPAYSAGQGAEMLIDNNTTTKYCAPFVNPMTISIKSDSALDIAKFSYTTADDTPNHDPVSFTLQYSSDYGETFNTILTVENATITTSRKTETQQWACS